MPKFLDAPVWYTESGGQIRGIGYGLTNTPGDGSLIISDGNGIVHGVNFSINGKEPTTMGPNNIYAPIVAGTAGQALISSGSGAPEWNNLFDYQVIYNTNTGNGPGAHYSDSSGGELDIFIPKRSEKTQYSCYFCGGVVCDDAMGITFDTHLDVSNSYATARGIAIAIGRKGIEGKSWMTTPSLSSAVLQDYIKVTYRFSIFTDSAFENISVSSGVLYYVYKETN